MGGGGGGGGEIVKMNFSVEFTDSIRIVLLYNLFIFIFFIFSL